MYKKAWCTCKIVVLLIKPIAFVTFPLPSPSSDLKVPTIVQEYQKIDVSSMIGYECSLRCLACNEQKQSQTDWDRQDEDEPNCHVSESWEKNKDRKLRWVANNYVILVILRLRAHGTGLCSVVSNRKQSRNTINQYLWINLNWYY